MVLKKNNFFVLIFLILLQSCSGGRIGNFLESSFENLEEQKTIENAKKKLLSKDCNLIVANDITLEGSGFGSDNNKAILVDKYGCEDLPLMKKSELAHKILDRTIRYID